MIPEVAAGTTAVICVAELTVKLVALVVPMATAVAPVKPVPVITIVPPLGEQRLPGVKEVIATQIPAVAVFTVSAVEFEAAE